MQRFVEWGYEMGDVGSGDSDDGDGVGVATVAKRKTEDSIL